MGHENVLRQIFVPQNIIGDSTADICRENLRVIGNELDAVDSTAVILINDMYPTDSSSLLPNFETTFQLPKNVGSTAQRRARVLAAHRARGGLSKAYFEILGNTMADNTYNSTTGYWEGGDYSVGITFGTNNLGFMIHNYSPNTDPKGPATLLPGRIYNDTTSDGPYKITVNVTGSSGPESDLENKFNKLKPAHTDMTYVYTP